jgi:hypothetical protein
MDAFTRFTNPADKATIPIIISAALPKVTLSKEAMVVPECIARCSVESPINFARGINAIAAKMKIKRGSE